MINPQEFINLYIKKDSDEVLTPFDNEVGFSLVRPYPENTQYNLDDLRIFLKVALLDKGLFYSVNMTKPQTEGEKTSYTILGGKEYKKQVTSFMCNLGDKEFIFDNDKKKIIHVKTKKELTLNEFVEVLVNNHLSDRLFWKRQKNRVANFILKTLFWLSDKHYENIQVTIDKYHFTRDNKPILKDSKNTEPFFRYFYISRNLIFTTLLAVFVVAIFSSHFPKVFTLDRLWGSLFGEFSLSNPFVTLFVFLVLFSAEKISKSLNSKIRGFLMPENNYFDKEKKKNFLEKLHNYQQRNSFDLKV